MKTFIQKIKTKMKRSRILSYLRYLSSSTSSSSSASASASASSSSSVAVASAALVAHSLPTTAMSPSQSNKVLASFFKRDLPSPPAISFSSPFGQQLLLDVLSKSLRDVETAIESRRVNDNHHHNKHPSSTFSSSLSPHGELESNSKDYRNDMSNNKYISSEDVEMNGIKQDKIDSLMLMTGNRGNYYHSFYGLFEQFTTQTEPSYCGLTSLIVVLNAHHIDPGRQWKGVWRWWSEEMLDCCEPLDFIKENGINFSKLACLARCNGAVVETYRPPADNVQNEQNLETKKLTKSNTTIEQFREHIKEATLPTLGNKLRKYMIVSYSRKDFLQTGDGHFSPIGAYHEEKDLVLIMDVARFKYPPHWVPLKMLYNAMGRIDKTTGEQRGYMMISSPSSKAPQTVLSLSVQQNDGIKESIQNSLNKLINDLPGEILGEITKCESDINPTSQITSDLIHFTARNIVLVALNMVGENLGLSLKHWVIETAKVSDCCGSQDCYSAIKGTVPKQLKHRFETLALCTKSTLVYQILSKTTTPIQLSSLNDPSTRLHSYGIGKLLLEQKHLPGVDPIFIQSMLFQIIPVDVWKNALSLISDSELGKKTLEFIINDMHIQTSHSKEPLLQEIEFLQMQMQNLINSKK